MFVGGVNAISGDTVDYKEMTTKSRLSKMANHESIQDYIVTPKQLWLDGIATAKGNVRQFVAMPLGSGYSVEAQVTGKEMSGDLQFQVVPSLPPSPKAPKNCDGIFVEGLTGEFMVLTELSGASTIDEIKDMIQDREGLPVEQQRLIFKSRRLEDGESFSLDRLRMMCLTL